MGDTEKNGLYTPSMQTYLWELLQQDAELKVVLQLTDDVSGI